MKVIVHYPNLRIMRSDFFDSQLYIGYRQIILKEITFAHRELYHLVELVEMSEDKTELWFEAVKEQK